MTSNAPPENPMLSQLNKLDRDITEIMGKSDRPSDLDHYLLIEKRKERDRLFDDYMKRINSYSGTGSEPDVNPLPHVPNIPPNLDIEELASKLNDYFPLKKGHSGVKIEKKDTKQNQKA